MTVAIDMFQETPSLPMLLQRVKARSGLDLKSDIAGVASLLPQLPKGWLNNGDDTSAIPLPEGLGYQLLAIEGMQGALVAEKPWFAGWCAVMVNCSDIAAMGGRPTAVVNALWWSHQDENYQTLVRGMVDASNHLGVPIVGGHTNRQAGEPNLAVSILGHAKRLLSSELAQAGQDLVVAVDLRGGFEGNSLNWNAATSAPSQRLRQDLALLPDIAEAELACACKDISQAGLLGTTVMLLESAGCGAEIELSAIPKPEEANWEQWLCAFPSFGYLLTCPKGSTQTLLEKFRHRDIACAVIGELDNSRQLTVRDQGQSEVFYNLIQHPLTGFG